MTASAIFTALFPILLVGLKEALPYLIPAIFQRLLTPYSGRTDFNNGVDEALATGDTSKLAYYNNLAIKDSNHLSAAEIAQMKAIL